jgi:hypothetical protein
MFYGIKFGINNKAIDNTDTIIIDNQLHIGHNAITKLETKKQKQSITI